MVGVRVRVRVRVRARVVVVVVVGARTGVAGPEAAQVLPRAAGERVLRVGRVRVVAQPVALLAVRRHVEPAGGRAWRVSQWEG